MFEQLNRIIGRTDKYTVSITSPKESSDYLASSIPATVPAWSTGDHIFLNSDIVGAELDEMTIEAFLHIKGLNLHELSHAMFTPRVGDFPYSRLTGDAARPGIMEVHNLLEDARIESMFTALYNASVPFFEAAVYRFILTPPTDGSRALEPKLMHALLAGRLYLPAEVRAAARLEAREVYGDDWVSDIEKVTRQYVGLRFPKENMLGVALVQQMWDLLNEAQQASAQPGMGVPQIANCGACSGERKVGGHHDSKVSAQASASAKHWTDDEDLDEVEAEVKAKAEQAEAEAESNGGDADDSSDEADGEGEGTPEGNSPSAGAGTSTEPVSPVFAEAQEALEELVGDVAVWEDYDRSNAAVRAILGGQGVQVTLDTKPKWIDPAPDVLREAHRLEQIFTELHQALEPDWRYRQQTGRLDVRRVVARQPHDVSVFKELTPGGLDEADMEFCILVDQSGSMASRMKSLSEVLWVIKRASDAVNIPVTVIGYSECAYGLMNPQELVNRMRVPVWPSYSATMATEAVKKAVDVLGASSAPTRCLLVLSDGSWGDSRTADPYIDSLAQSGVMTAFFYFDSQYRMVQGEEPKPPATHGCEHAVAINRMEAVGDFFVTVAETTMMGTIEALN